MQMGPPGLFATALKLTPEIPPELYSEFFTSFTKSYEVRGYKP